MVSWKSHISRREQLTNCIQCCSDLIDESSMAYKRSGKSRSCFGLLALSQLEEWLSVCGYACVCTCTCMQGCTLLALSFFTCNTNRY